MQRHQLSSTETRVVVQVVVVAGRVVVVSRGGVGCVTQAARELGSESDRIGRRLTQPPVRCVVESFAVAVFVPSSPSQPHRRADLLDNLEPSLLHPITRVPFRL